MTSIGLAIVACLAVVIPTLIAYNVAPSATFFNQAAAFFGWGLFVAMVAAAAGQPRWPHDRAAVAMLATLGVVGLAALGASAIGAAPWSLSLSAALTVASAILTLAVGASAMRSGNAEPAFRAFCIALVVAGLASSAIGLEQVFFPDLPDGDWIAGSAIPGRATGNLRQPNHLSSLLLWSIVGAVWLAEVRVLHRVVAAAFVALFVWVIVLSASRTGALAMITLALWGIADRRLSRQARIALIVAPLVYGLVWWGMTVWATNSHHLFGGQTRFGGSGDISSSRFAIWRDTLSLIRMHPWAGIGFGEFNFAWSLTPFPARPVAFFDHTHNIVLNFLVELGIPLGTLVLAAMAYSLWRAFVHATAAGSAPGSLAYPLQRPAFVIVLLAATHSMLEYPLWYSYFLLPTAFALGLCLERPRPAAEPGPAGVAATAESVATRPFVLAGAAMALLACFALYDYMRVAIIFAPPADAAPLEQRIANGQHSVLFGHHADYAAATTEEASGNVIGDFDRASHYLLDTRLMIAWAKALEDHGDDNRARYLAARLREFRNADADEFFAPCAAGAAASAPAMPLPFQCRAPAGSLGYEDFYKLAARPSSGSR